VLRNGNKNLTCGSCHWDEGDVQEHVSRTECSQIYEEHRWKLCFIALLPGLQSGFTKNCRFLY
jgi:cytochrome c